MIGDSRFEQERIGSGAFVEARQTVFDGFAHCQTNFDRFVNGLLIDFHSFFIGFLMDFIDFERTFSQLVIGLLGCFHWFFIGFNGFSYF